MDSAGARRVGAQLDLSVTDSADVFLQVAVADLGTGGSETLTVTLDGAPISVEEVVIAGEGRSHRFAASKGILEIRYEATMVGRATPPSVTAAEEIIYLRPSRYAESDRLAGFAAAEFAGIDDPRQLLPAVSSWVGGHLTYVPGSSRPTDGAVQTMLQREGVCRDYAHLVVALSRALDIPARVAAVYAPGLDPMDFHAVAEVAINGAWHVVDATLLAPRSSLIRICTGRDAADIAFLSTYRGEVTLLRTEVTATVDGDLPSDNVLELVALR